MTSHLCGRCRQPIRDPAVLENLQHGRAYEKVYQQIEREHLSERVCDGKGEITETFRSHGFTVPIHRVCPGCEKCNPPKSEPEAEKIIEVFRQSLCLDCARVYDGKQTRECYTRGVKAVATHVRQEQAAEIERLRGALLKIKKNCGRVCDEYETCQHPTCESSYSTWTIADNALRGVTPTPDAGDTAPSLESRVAELERRAAIYQRLFENHQERFDLHEGMGEALYLLRQRVKALEERLGIPAE